MKEKILIFCCFLWGTFGCDVAFAQQFVSQENLEIPFDTLSGAFWVKHIERISKHVFCLKVKYASNEIDKSEYLESDFGIFDVAICDTLCSYKKAKRIIGKKCFMTIVSLFPIMSSSCMIEKNDVDFYGVHFPSDNNERVNPKYYVCMITDL